jgi:hypothetical protein
MQLMTLQDVRSLLAETDHALVVEDFELIADLDKLAEIVVSGPRDNSESIYAFPVLAGGDAFFAPSIGKQIFWEEHIAGAIGEDWLTCAYLWLLSRPDIPTERGPEIFKAVKTWGRRCKLTAADVDKVTAAYANDEKGSGSRAAYGEIISLLVREYGQDVNHWLNAPEHEISMLLGDWTRRQEAKAAEYRRSKVGSKNPLPPLPSPKMTALKNYRELKNRIRDSWLQKR